MPRPPVFSVQVFENRAGRILAADRLTATDEEDAMSKAHEAAATFCGAAALCQIVDEMGSAWKTTILGTVGQVPAGFADGLPIG